MSTGENLLTETLRSQGLRVTPDRLLVFQELSTHPLPLAIAQVVEQLSPRGVNQTTVYRILELFTAIGVAHPVLVSHGTIGYELIPPFRRHHHHLLCVQCNAIVDLYDCEMEKAIQQIATNHHYKMLFHDIIIHGICPTCQAQQSIDSADPATSDEPCAHDAPDAKSVEK
ncbi:MAG: Fur family transcriptional regulator [Firmicutes bacterium]|nr:Fur family transcriptional regulator [Bacillota bacterium]